MEYIKLSCNDLIKFIAKYYKMDRKYLANILNCNISLIGFYFTNKKPISIEKVILLNKEIEKRGSNVYDFIFNYINGYYFHGSKIGIRFPISPTYSKKIRSDFGRGFYIGESFRQSSTFISSSNIKFSRVYSLNINFTNLNILDISPINNNDYRWILTIAMYRDYIREDNYPNLYIAIKDILKGFDVIKGPIADDRMTTVMDKFFNNKITNIQLIDCLTKMNLGNQYCFLTEKSVKNIAVINEISFDKTTMTLINEYEKREHLNAVNYSDEQVNYKYKVGKTFLEILNEIKENKWKLVLE